MNELELVLREYEERKAHEVAEYQAKLEAEAGFRARTCDVLRTVVIPEMQEFAATLNQRGHEAEIRETLTGVERPGVELGLSAMQPDGRFLEPSRLLMVGKAPASVEVVRDVRARKPDNCYSGSSSYFMDSLTAETVQEILLHFVKRVLEVS